VQAVAAQAPIAELSFLFASTTKEVEQPNRAEQLHRRDDLVSAGERVQFY
jgi:hypothetical protein